MPCIAQVPQCRFEVIGEGGWGGGGAEEGWGLSGDFDGFGAAAGDD